jgi:two-component system chemotaxis response regulator CheB
MNYPATIIVIGASAGGVEVLRTIVSALPEDLEAAVFVTLHIGAHRSDLPWLLTRAGDLPAKHPRNGEPITKGAIYVAPPDHHMLVEAGRVLLTKGPRENWSRPAIDPMFRSAARAYGSDVIGVILTGGLNDGTAGLFEVKANGGTAVVQDPADATTPNMPQSALENVDVDHVLGAEDIGPCLVRLVTERYARRGVENHAHAPAAHEEKPMDAQFTLNPPIAVTCPDCGGALRQSELGSLTQFSCHVGHVYTMEVMLAAQFLAVDQFLEQAMRSLSERAELCRIMAEKIPGGEAHEAERQLWLSARQEALDQTRPLREMLTREWLHPAKSGTAGLSGSQ